MLAGMEHDRWVAATKRTRVPTARNGPSERIPTSLLGRGSQRTREGEGPYVRAGLLALLEAEGLAIVRTPGFALGILLYVVGPWSMALTGDAGSGRRGRRGNVRHRVRMAERVAPIPHGPLPSASATDPVDRREGPDHGYVADIAVNRHHRARRYASAGLIEYLDAGGPVVPIAPARHRATPALPQRGREQARARAV
jgi:preprotein translocase subunit Sec61beta